MRSAFRPDARDYWRRWAQIAGAALLVSAGSALVFGPRYIWFGILHFVAAALILVRPLIRLGTWNLALGVAVVAIGLAFADPTFNEPPLAVLGFVAALPRTEDFVPLFPWLGVVLIGAGLGSMWQKRDWQVPAALRPFNSSPPAMLVFLGTWALTVYLVHQPVLMGTLSILKRLGN